MSVIYAMQDYVNKCLNGIDGMKVLLLDAETLMMISMVFSQSEILQKQVFLFERIDTVNRETMMHMKGVVFVRPTEENMELLKDELGSPKYGEYHLFFTNIVKVAYLDVLAQADKHSVVQQVQEYFADFYAINTDLFSLNLPSVVTSDRSEQTRLISRICDGIGSILLSFKKKPIIRFEKLSELSQRVSQELARRMEQEKLLFDFRRGEPPVLLIIDRRSDPVTPLLSQWTYQAMVHELLGIRSNRVDLRVAKPGAEEIVLSPEQDEFYANNAFANWGELALSIQDTLVELQKHHNISKQLKSLEDMKNFVANFPEYQKYKGNVTKHLELVDIMSNLVTERQLLTVSEVEQGIACNMDHSTALRNIIGLIQDPNLRKEEKLRLCLLYALRFEQSGNLQSVVETLYRTGFVPEDVSTVRTLVQWAGVSSRTGDLFSEKSLMSMIKKSVKKAVQGAEIVYTQHKPLLLDQLTDLSKGKLSLDDYPVLTGAVGKAPPSEVIVFIIGGATYEEALTVHTLNATPESRLRVILGGTDIINSTQFIHEVEKIRDGLSN